MWIIEFPSIINSIHSIYVLRVFHRPGPVLANLYTVVHKTLSLSSKNSLDIRDHGPGGAIEWFLMVLQCNLEK